MGRKGNVEDFFLFLVFFISFLFYLSFRLTGFGKSRSRIELVSECFCSGLNVVCPYICKQLYFLCVFFNLAILTMKISVKRRTYYCLSIIFLVFC